jgi:hypothetical protein
MALMIAFIFGAFLFSFMMPLIKPVQAQMFTNVEEWEIIRDPATGRTLGIRVHRDAMVNG